MIYTPPPTTCDRSLKAKVITDGDIEKAILWYEANRSRIAAQLSASKRIEGTTYTQQWQSVFEGQTLPQWRSKKMPHTLAEAYIYAALKRLWRGLEGQS